MQRALAKVFGTSNDRVIKRIVPIVEQIGALGPQFASLSDAELLAKTPEFRQRLENGEELDDLLEWDYGQYEGKKTVDIRQDRPDWQLFRDGCPGGESPGDVAKRADRVIDTLRAIGDNVLVFSSGHFFRVFGARWLGLEPAAGRYLLLSTATLSIVGYEHNLNEPVIRLWNDDRHVTD